jgi:PIN domain nuclease of toxin-antitoxin system
MMVSTPMSSTANQIHRISTSARQLLQMMDLTWMNFTGRRTQIRSHSSRLSLMMGLRWTNFTVRNLPSKQNPNKRLSLTMASLWMITMARQQLLSLRKITIRRPLKTMECPMRILCAAASARNHRPPSNSMTIASTITTKITLATTKAHLTTTTVARTTTMAIIKTKTATVGTTTTKTIAMGITRAVVSITRAVVGTIRAAVAIITTKSPEMSPSRRHTKKTISTCLISTEQRKRRLLNNSQPTSSLKSSHTNRAGTRHMPAASSNSCHLRKSRTSATWRLSAPDRATTSPPTLSSSTTRSPARSSPKTHTISPRLSSLRLVDSTSSSPRRRMNF